MTEPKTPSAEELKQAHQQAQEAGTAAAVAIAEAPPEKRQEEGVKAVKGAAAKMQFELSDEDADKIVSKMIKQMDAMGAFAPPPPPEAESAAPAAAAEPPVEPPEPPRKKTLAEKFAGL